MAANSGDSWILFVSHTHSIHTYTHIHVEIPLHTCTCTSTTNFAKHVTETLTVGMSELVHK